MPSVKLVLHTARAWRSWQNVHGKRL